MRTSLTAVSSSEVLARVAIQIAIRKWHLLGSPSPLPVSMVYLASADLPKSGFGQLRFACHSLAAHLATGVSASEWYRGVAYRAEYGGVFRWHFFAGYKSNRNPYPRVTNRGVQTSPPPASFSLETVGNNA